MVAIRWLATALFYIGRPNEYNITMMWPWPPLQPRRIVKSLGGAEPTNIP